MKNILNRWGTPHKVFPSKLILTMKLVVFIICFTSLGVFASNSYSQSTKLSLNMNNASIKKVLLEIENNSEFYFLYNNNLVDVERKVDVKVNDKKVNEVLDLVFDGQEVDFSVMDRQIIISPKNLPDSKQQAITGKITDEFGELLPGVTVLIKGTTSGTVTDIDGKFSLIATPEQTLVFSFIGMKSQEIAVGSQTEINISLATDAIGLEEVIAVGYGTMRKSDLTGSVTKVNIEELAELPNVSVIQSMQGTVAGLNIGAVDAAGENPSISIRGQNSLSSGSSANSPLIVVDGTIYRGSLVDLNTADIESVDILKDASSAAIYGSQASNGVMLITTKKGDESGKPIINYSGSYTLQAPTNTLDPMGADELEGFLLDAYWADGSRMGPDYLETDPTFDVGEILRTPEMTDGYNNGVDNSLWDDLTGNGYINTHNISVRGKTKTFGYYFSGGITDVQGYMANDEYTKYNYRINLDADINSWMNVGMETFLTSSDYSGVAPNSGPAWMLHPWSSAYEENGDPKLLLQDVWFNPLLTIEQDDSDKRLNMFANIHADIKLPIKGLSYRINFSQNYRTTNHDNFDIYGAGYLGSGYKNANISYDYTADNILTYKRTFNEKHKLNATFVYGVEKRTYSYTNASAQNFTDMSLGYNSLEQGDPTLRGLNTGREEEQSLYTMGRVAYNYNNKYLLTGTVRRDGFSGFGVDQKIGVFPSLALGWVASEESFVKDNVNWIDYLKIRASYGSTGRRAVGRYDTQAIVTATPRYVFGDGVPVTSGQYTQSMANDQLGWETTTGLNVGADFAVFNSRLHGNVEYYNNNTKDILYAISIPYMTGFSSINTNIGKVANHGLEFTLSGSIIKTNDFSWEASVNFSRNRNEIVSILGKDDDGDGIEDDMATSGLFIGEPTDVIYDYDIIGMWQLQDEADDVIPNGFYAGTYKIADISGPDGEPDGKYSSTYDRKVQGYKDPSYRMGIANTFNYKKFSLYVFVNTVQGGKDYYYATDALPFNKTNTNIERYSSQNVPSGGWDYWMPENTDARFRRLDTYASYNPERYAQRNFIRLQDVSLSYNFSKKLLSKWDISNLKVFVSGKNLATITKWRGWDPETGQGFELGTPLMANYTFGVNVEF